MQYGNSEARMHAQGTLTYHSPPPTTATTVIDPQHFDHTSIFTIAVFPQPPSPLSVLAVGWSRTLVPEHEYSSSTIDATGAVFSGSSCGCAQLSHQHTDPDGGGSPTLVDLEGQQVHDRRDRRGALRAFELVRPAVRPTHEWSSSTIDATGAVFSGDSYDHAQLSGQSTDPDGSSADGGGSPSLVAWVQVEGSYSVLLGAATAGIDRTEHLVGGPQPSWGVILRNRGVFHGSEWVGDGREAGPDRFSDSCVLRVAIDSGAGTLSISIVGGDDLGVVIDQLPNDEPLHLAVATDSGDCRVTLLDGESIGGFWLRALIQPNMNAHKHTDAHTQNTRTHTYKHTG